MDMNKFLKIFFVFVSSFYLAMSEEVKDIEKYIEKVVINIKKNVSDEEVLSKINHNVFLWNTYFIENQDFDIKSLLSAIELAVNQQIHNYVDSYENINHFLDITQLLWNEGEIRNINVLLPSLFQNNINQSDLKLIEVQFGPRVRLTIDELTKINNGDLDLMDASLDAQTIYLAHTLRQIRTSSCSLEGFKCLYKGINLPLERHLFE